MSLSADTQEWLDAVRRDADRLKVTIQSNGRISETFRIAEASVIESVFKKCRTAVGDES